MEIRNGDDAVVQGIKDALKGAKLHYAYDATSEHNSYTNIVQVLEPKGHLTLVLPGRKYEGIPDTVQQSITSVGEAHKGDKDFAYIYFRYLARGLAEGFFKPHPHEVVKGGLEGVEEGLRNLKEGKASGTKYVFRIGEGSSETCMRSVSTCEGSGTIRLGRIRRDSTAGAFSSAGGGQDTAGRRATGAVAR